MESSEFDSELEDDLLPLVGASVKWGKRCPSATPAAGRRREGPWSPLKGHLKLGTLRPHTGRSALCPSPGTEAAFTCLTGSSLTSPRDKMAEKRS